MASALSCRRGCYMFLSPKRGQMTIYQTSGNPSGHIIMRGGKAPNYHPADIAAAVAHLRDTCRSTWSSTSAMGTVSSNRLQKEVSTSVAQQIRNGSRAIAGVMIESFLQEGTQKVTPETPLVYGQSITDPCLGWDDTASVLQQLADAVDSRF
ncbi:hypothetical protein [Erwinia sp. MYb535]